MNSLLRVSRLSRLGLAALLLAGGCATRPVSDMVIVGPDYEPSNIYGRGWQKFTRLRRVAVAPLAGCAPLETRERLRTILESELAKTAQFELVRLCPEELESLAGQRILAANESLPKTLLANLRERLGCDGVMFWEVTRYDPYPPLAVGWKLRLAATATGDTLWMADEVFDAGQPSVVNGARRYQREHSPVSGSLADSRLILLSPVIFSRYSAQTLLACLAEPKDP